MLSTTLRPPGVHMEQNSLYRFLPWPGFESRTSHLVAQHKTARPPHIPGIFILQHMVILFPIVNGEQDVHNATQKLWHKVFFFNTTYVIMWCLVRVFKLVALYSLSLVSSSLIVLPVFYSVKISVEIKYYTHKQCWLLKQVYKKARKLKYMCRQYFIHLICNNIKILVIGFIWRMFWWHITKACKNVPMTQNTVS